ncbi:MAG: Ig-like domain-containing protein [Bryobacteraceae bacterium]
MTAPVNGSTVSGTVSMQASASDGAGVASVSFAADGVTLCSVASAPYTCAWNIASYANGSHSATATALDTAGNSASSGVTVNVQHATLDRDHLARQRRHGRQDGQHHQCQR